MIHPFLLTWCSPPGGCITPARCLALWETLSYKWDVAHPYSRILCSALVSKFGEYSGHPWGYFLAGNGSLSLIIQSSPNSWPWVTRFIYTASLNIADQTRVSNWPKVGPIRLLFQGICNQDSLTLSPYSCGNECSINLRGWKVPCA